MTKEPIITNYGTELYKLKDKTSKELGLTLNPASSEDLHASVENIFIGGRLGGQMTKNLIEMAEKQLIEKYK